MYLGDRLYTTNLIKKIDANEFIHYMALKKRIDNCAKDLEAKQNRVTDYPLLEHGN